MTYAELIIKSYFKNKPSDDDKLIATYKAYKEFCYAIGVKPKGIIRFLKTKVI